MCEQSNTFLFTNNERCSQISFVQNESGDLLVLEYRQSRTRKLIRNQRVSAQVSTSNLDTRNVSMHKPTQSSTIQPSLLSQPAGLVLNSTQSQNHAPTCDQK